MWEIDTRWFDVAVVMSILAAAVVHLWWLPKNGINGWTAEPYDKYLELIRAKRG